jgi:hypothetical protein
VPAAFPWVRKLNLLKNILRTCLIILFIHLGVQQEINEEGEDRFPRFKMKFSKC